MGPFACADMDPAGLIWPRLATFYTTIMADELSFGVDSARGEIEFFPGHLFRARARDRGPGPRPALPGGKRWAFVYLGHRR